MKWNWKKDLSTIAGITIASVVMAVNIKSFVRTGGLYPGGATGLTILIQSIFKLYFNIELPYTLINILINSVPVYIGFRFIGRKFTIYSVITIILTGILTDLLPGLQITEDILLISIFGGIINGAAISICLLSGATTGGTDFIGIYLSDKKNVDSFNIVLAVNAVILLMAGLFFGWDKALYSLIFQYASTTVIHALYKKYQQSTLFIVTSAPNEVTEAIYRITVHGATILEGEGSYDHSERKVIYSVVSRAEASKVISEVMKIDSHAFINEIDTRRLQGNFYHRPEE